MRTFIILIFLNLDAKYNWLNELDSLDSFALAVFLIVAVMQDFKELSKKGDK